MRRKRVRLEAINVTREQADFVRNRVRPLIEQHLDRPIIDILTDAYCQGMTDAQAVLTRSEIAP